MILLFPWSYHHLHNENRSFSCHFYISKSVRDLTRRANPVSGKSLRVHWKKQTALLPEIELRICSLCYDSTLLGSLLWERKSHIKAKSSLYYFTKVHLHSVFGHKAELVKVPSSVPSRHLGSFHLKDQSIMIPNIENR